VRPAAALAERLGLPVGDSDLVEQGLVHTSWLHEHPTRRRPQRAARVPRRRGRQPRDLGGAVRRHPPTTRGSSAPARHRSSRPSGSPASPPDRPRRVLFLGEGEAQRGGRRRPSILASAFEALAGALYLELGFDATRDWLHGSRARRSRWTRRLDA
jgi:ribonuclease-3